LAQQASPHDLGDGVKERGDKDFEQRRVSKVLAYRKVLEEWELPGLAKQAEQDTPALVWRTCLSDLRQDLEDSIAETHDAAILRKTDGTVATLAEARSEVAEEGQVLGLG
jgi:hypothetical protein